MNKMKVCPLDEDLVLFLHCHIRLSQVGLLTTFFANVTIFKGDLSSHASKVV